MTLTGPQRENSLAREGDQAGQRFRVNGATRGVAPAPVTFPLRIKRAVSRLELPLFRYPISDRSRAHKQHGLVEKSLFSVDLQLLPD